MDKLFIFIIISLLLSSGVYAQSPTEALNPSQLNQSELREANEQYFDNLYNRTEPTPQEESFSFGDPLLLLFVSVGVVLVLVWILYGINYKKGLWSEQI